MLRQFLDDLFGALDALCIRGEHEHHRVGHLYTRCRTDLRLSGPGVDQHHVRVRVFDQLLLEQLDAPVPLAVLVERVPVEGLDAGRVLAVRPAAVHESHASEAELAADRFRELLQVRLDARQPPLSALLHLFLEVLEVVKQTPFAAQVGVAQSEVVVQPRRLQVPVYADHV